MELWAGLPVLFPMSAYKEEVKREIQKALDDFGPFGEEFSENSG